MNIVYNMKIIRKSFTAKINSWAYYTFKCNKKKNLLPGLALCKQLSKRKCIAKRRTSQY